MFKFNHLLGLAFNLMVLFNNLILIWNILQASQEKEMIEETSSAPAIGGSFGVILVVIAVAVIIIYRKLVCVSFFSRAKLKHPLQSVEFVKKAKNK